MTGTLPVAGALSLATVRSTFGLTGPLSLGQLYRGGSIVPNGPTQNANVPTSGAISLGDLYGTTDVASPTGYTFTATISANTQNYDLASAATAAGWNGTEALFASVTINGGVVVGSNSTSSYALTIPSLPANSTVTLTNNGYIVGMGGNGGSGAGTHDDFTPISASSPSVGGPALLVQYPTTLTGSGTIGSGGGGGGGGGSGIQSNQFGVQGGGGGGGAGAVPGGGGARESMGSSTNYFGSNGGGASLTGGAAGGSPGYFSNNPSTIFHGGTGGSGGPLGKSGAAGASATGANVYGASSGGASAGVAITGNGNISYQWSGSVLGPVS